MPLMAVKQADPQQIVYFDVEVEGGIAYRRKLMADEKIISGFSSDVNNPRRANPNSMLGKLATSPWHSMKEVFSTITTRRIIT